MYNMNKKYILKEIKRANNLTILIFNYLYNKNDKSLNKILFRITEINEILTNLEIEMEEK